MILNKIYLLYNALTAIKQLGVGTLEAVDYLEENMLSSVKYVEFIPEGMKSSSCWARVYIERKVGPDRWEGYMCEEFPSSKAKWVPVAIKRQYLLATYNSEKKKITVKEVSLQEWMDSNFEEICKIS